MSVISVQLTRHKFKTVHLTAPEASETAFNVLDTLVSAAMKRLAQDVLQAKEPFPPPSTTKLQG